MTTKWDRPSFFVACYFMKTSNRSLTVAAPIRAATVRERWAFRSCQTAIIALALAALRFYTPPDCRSAPFVGSPDAPAHCADSPTPSSLSPKASVGEALHLNALSPLAVVMIAGTFWNAPRMARFWTPCIAIFGAYGLWRIAF